MPAGTTPSGLPVGVQIVAPHGADRLLLAVAAAFETAPLCGRKLSTGPSDICAHGANFCG